MRLLHLAVVVGCAGSGDLDRVPLDPEETPTDGLVDTSDPPTSTPTTDDTGTPPITEPPPSCTGLAGAPGNSNRDVQIGPDTRTFIVHVPPNLDPNVAVPVVLVFHGYTMSGALMADITSWSAVADREGFVVVYADGDTGFGGPWNVGSGACGSGAALNTDNDDFGFVEAMLASVAQDQCLDRDRVFGSGFSMGAYFVHNLACRGPGIVRAIAPHSGGTYTGDCDNGPVPVLVLHGSNDVVIDVGCGEAAAAEWVLRDVCDAGSSTVLQVEGGSCDVFEDCDDGGAVTSCVFAGMDHGWAGSTSFLYGGGTGYADAAELSWAFFEAASSEP